ncbi:outer membrane protein assembly factor BamE [Thermodesulfatator atlanticus]|uniref:outer membrane protein assembly factor BamE n=1 Tax=Thermodesulfatator atlanticus TaxID=501497 RepID=UPI0003B5870D|nr:outer membrane protein assembly factor BamE [Thermodesulfatator atlanticus]
MKKVLYFIIAILALSLTSCASVPERNLASDASLVRKGFSTKEEVYQLLGKPDKIIHKDSETEEWYYYQVNENIWKKIPLLSAKFGKEEIEVLKITFHGDRVFDCIYYVTERH